MMELHTLVITISIDTYIHLPSSSLLNTLRYRKGTPNDMANLSHSLSGRRSTTLTKSASVGIRSIIIQYIMWFSTILIECL